MDIVDKESISVLICDDSALMRNLVGRIIDKADGLRVAGKAMNGRFALQKIPKLDPDVMILDLEMPEMNGIEFLKERKKAGIEVPVIILSSLAKRGAKITMDALSLGASDFILKPSGSVSEDIHTVGEHIVKTVRAYGQKYHRRKAAVVNSDKDIPVSVSKKVLTKEAISAKSEPAVCVSRKRNAPINIVAIGISTGGPNALREVFSSIDPKLDVPILIVQHMPAGFTQEFANSLDRVSPLDVKEAAEGDLLINGRVLIAPGDFHIEIEKKSLASIIHISQTAHVNGHRPSAGVLFSSVAKTYGKNALGVIMTGMGKDGSKEIGSIYNAGGVTIGQDENSSIVYGMPRVAFNNGFIEHVVPLKNIASEIGRIVKENR